MYIGWFIWTAIWSERHHDIGLRERTRSKSLNEVLQFRRDVQIFYSITTRNPRESIGLVFSVFRDELAGSDGLNRSYVSGVTRGADPDGGCRYQMMRETGEEPLLEIALSRPGQQVHDAILEAESPGDTRLQ